MIPTEAVDPALTEKPELRILHMFGALGVGGAETWLLSLLKHFNASAADLPFTVTTHVCLTNGTPGELDDDARQLGARLHYIRYSRTDLFRFAREFRRLLATHSFHAIHDHQDYSAGIHFLLGLGRLPAVRIAHVHNTAYRLTAHRDTASRWAGNLGKRVLHYTGATVAGTSRQLLEEYGFDFNPSLTVGARTLYCGFDTHRYLEDRGDCRSALRAEIGWAPADPIILFVGRLGEETLATGPQSQKNPVFALQTFEQAFARQPNLRMLFVGEKGLMHEVLSEMIDQHNLQRSVRFLGLRDDIPRLMLGSDLLLFPSLAEGLGMVAVEAQAAGLRVLASDTTPRECVVVPELITFVPLAAGTRFWADKLLELVSLRPPDFSVCNAIVAASPFSIEISASQVLELYTSGVSKDPRSGSMPGAEER